jgi:SAM-dependent methyltransferase
VHDLATVFEGFFAGCLLRELFAADVLQQLAAPTTPAALASRLKADEQALVPSLEFLARTTRAIERVGQERYRLGPDLRSPAGIAALAKFLGAYGPPAWCALASWRSARSGAGRVDHGALMSAFALAPRDAPLVIDLVRKRARSGLLDLGCGTGAFLSAVCTRGGPSGWGIDRSSHMCRLARRHLRKRGLDRHVRVRRGDAMDAARLLSSRERAKIDTIYAASLFNALMRPSTRAIRLLRSLRHAYPGRTLINLDYLGVLARPRAGRTMRGAMLQDLAQVLSGQGIPPASHDEWAEMYRDAGCDLTDVVQVETAGLRWFLHTVTL